MNNGNMDRVSKMVIGSMLMNRNAYGFCVDRGLIPDWLTEESHRAIFAAIQSMKSRGIPIESDLIVSELHGKIAFSEVQDLFDADVMGDLGRLGHHLEILGEAHQTRRIAEACRDALLEIEDGQNPEEVLSSTMLKLVAAEKVQQSEATPEQIRDEIMEDVKLARSQGHTGLSLPWESALDTFGGLPNLLTLLAGRRGSGKSTIARNIARHLSERGDPVAMVILEDTVKNHLKQLAGDAFNFNVFHEESVKRPYTETEEEKYRNALEEVQKLPIHVIDNIRTVERICSYASMMKAKHGVKSIIIDNYTQIQTSGKMRDLQQRDEHVSSSLADLATRLDINVTVICHVTQSHESEGRRIDLRDVRGYGQVVDRARFVMALDQLATDKEEEPRRMILNCIKSNNGPQGHVYLRHEYERHRFSEWEN